LRILHVLRSPVGGLFRHVRDLARKQTHRGHEVGIVCDTEAIDALTRGRLREMAAILKLGVHETAMPRTPGFGDLPATRFVAKLAGELSADVLHGHGAKGGAYARLAGLMIKPRPATFYTPHGGSLHYSPSSLQGRIFLALERQLSRYTSGLIFESAFSQAAFLSRVGQPECIHRVIHNGLLEDEFFDHASIGDSTDFLFIGELRQLKGVDILIEAFARVRTEHDITLRIVGAGPDEDAFKAMAEALCPPDAISFAGARPAAEAFPTGRCLVVPSRAESFPYIVLEGAAQAIPMIATCVGGIPEIVEGTSVQLIEANSVDALADAMRSVIQRPDDAHARAKSLQAKTRDAFSVTRMTDAVLAFYADANEQGLALAAA
jgi:glycosyltransferase involved in cell wall biosynthesis